MYCKGTIAGTTAVIMAAAMKGHNVALELYLPINAECYLVFVMESYPNIPFYKSLFGMA